MGDGAPGNPADPSGSKVLTPQLLARWVRVLELLRITQRDAHSAYSKICQPPRRVSIERPVPRSSAVRVEHGRKSRILAAFEQENLVERDAETLRFRLGLGLIAVAGSCIGSASETTPAGAGPSTTANLRGSGGQSHRTAGRQRHQSGRWDRRVAAGEVKSSMRAVVASSKAPREVAKTFMAPMPCPSAISGVLSSDRMGMALTAALQPAIAGLWRRRGRVRFVAWPRR